MPDRKVLERIKSATVAIAMGQPLEVPKDADEDAIESARKAVEDRLFTLEQRAAALLR